jgi:hypothetical protein
MLFVALKPATYWDLDGEFDRLHAVRASHPDAALALFVGEWDQDEHRYDHYVYRYCTAAGDCTCCSAELAEAA